MSIKSFQRGNSEYNPKFDWIWMIIDYCYDVNQDGLYEPIRTLSVNRSMEIIDIDSLDIIGNSLQIDISENAL